MVDLPILDDAIVSELRLLGKPDNPDLFKTLLQTYLTSADELWAEIEKAMTVQDASCLQKAAHSLKGSSRNVGATRLGQACADLEAAVKASHLNTVPLLAKAVSQELARARAALQQLLV